MLALGDVNVVRRASATALGQIGPAAAEAVPALIKVLGDAERVVRGRAAEALGKIGPAAAEAVPALIKVLGDAECRPDAAEALGKIGPAAAEAVPALIKALGDAECAGCRRGPREDAGGRRRGGTGADQSARRCRVPPGCRRSPREDRAGGGEAVPALIKVLGDAEWSVRRDAAEALGKIGPAAAEAVPALIKVLGDAEGSGAPPKPSGRSGLRRPRPYRR